MREGWTQTTLGGVCDFTKGTTPTMKTRPGPYPLVVTAEARASSDEYQFDGEAVCIPMVSSTGHGHASLKRVHYQAGKFAVANIITACTRKPAAPLVMRYLWLLLDHWRNELVVPLMKGTANVSLSQQALRSVQLELPPVAEQRRIVDLIRALDNAIDSAEASKRAAETMLGELRRPPAGVVGPSLGELVTMRSGPSWKSIDEGTVPSPGAVPVLGITNTPAGGQLDLSRICYVTGLPNSVQKLTDRSLVMIRTNGNRQRIGNVYRATSEVSGFAVSAFQIAIEPIGQTDIGFLYWLLGSDEVQTQITSNASGSTGLGNIAVGWLKNLKVPVLDDDLRTGYVDRCESAEAVLAGHHAHSARLRDLRSNLLPALLSGAHEIPESYDALMEVAS